MSEGDEFRRIDRFLRPLTRSHPAALELRNDAAFLDLPPGRQLVISSDSLVEGLHYVGDEPPRDIARKALRVNLSDLAGCGAAPLCYSLNLALPCRFDDAWLADFAAGLGADQDEFGLVLIGGDSVVPAAGPAVITLTIFGLVDSGQGLTRAGAASGDDIWVSGSIGDGALGLMVARGEYPPALQSRVRAALRDRYRLPRPRLTLGRALSGMATAAMDVSDGLIGDLEHLAEESGLRAELWADYVPLSEAARDAVALLGGIDAMRETLLAGGDDYEVLFTAAPEHRQRLADQVSGDRTGGVALSRIGVMRDGGTGGTDGTDGAGATEATDWRVSVIDSSGRPLPVTRRGFRHG